ncbi:hypothetical protein B0H67DRAFT_660985 [Lasiosphaeris hirsuta]|uniref:Protein kinase domain-containing protein n=1 Tax=Lasiosphaeris hirsuta TaxID=260670 RepID=A0AA40AP53_9PEZI|nr:hypothetical protein B0H67DRAFT_660985 [Lasiosphaeris hirsuta]
MGKAPDEAIFPKLKLPDDDGDDGGGGGSSEYMSTVPESYAAGPAFYTKRPGHLESLMSHDGDNHLTDTLTIPDLLLHEARMLDLLWQHPQHPNIIRYHGYRVRRGFMTGLDRFMVALEPAVDHLYHIVGIAHNDICPANVMVRPDGMPCLIDFNSAPKIGHQKPWACSTVPWHDEKGDPGISQKRHDLYGLAKIRWLLNHPDKFTDPYISPVFSTRIRLQIDPTEPDDPNANTPPPSSRGLPDPSCPTLNKIVCILTQSKTMCALTCDRSNFCFLFSFFFEPVAQIVVLLPTFPLS